MNIKYILGILLLFLCGCKDDLLNNALIEGAEGEGVEAYLSLSVSDFSIVSDGSRGEEPSEIKEEATEYENRIDNIWVFQYRVSDGNKLRGNYYTISDQAQLEKLQVTLDENVASHICVVANTGNPAWGNGAGFNTYEGMKLQALSSPEPIMYSEYSDISTIPAIPMEGIVENVRVMNGSIIKVGVARMYAKVKISFGDLVNGMSPKSIEINNIPKYCRVQSLGSENGSANLYENCPEWVTRTYDTDKKNDVVEGADSYKREFIIYMPENLQGVKAIPDDQGKNDVAPERALVVRMRMNYTYVEPVPVMGYEDVHLDEDRQYTVYPGGNISDNYDIKRNHVYRVKINVKDATEHTPSSNCFVVAPGKNIAFEPYYREETGGGYMMSSYLNPDEEDKAIGGVHHVQILWQTKDAIGDNSDGSRVWFVKDNDNPIYSRIIVRANKEGNALIGAYNSKNEIIWSWHIWIRNNDPSNVSKAMIYKTYRWDASGIKANEARVEGYAVMPCNLGALDDVPAIPKNWNSTTRTFGMLYQWGRKDPFPPLTKQTSPEEGYTNELAGTHYDYTNRVAVGKTSITGTPGVGTLRAGSNVIDPNVSFFSYMGNKITSIQNSIKFGINNPLVFICGAKEVNKDLANYCNKSENYFNQGDWIASGSDDKLWGGKTPDLNNGAMKHLNVVSTIYIFDNYGEEGSKSIFDPCPKGWRVPPGDLWLGFTKNGLNDGDINYDVINTEAYKINDSFSGGMFMYMQDFGKGSTLYFPTQGPRIGSGMGMRVGICGNYHNATVTTNNRVNILHVHNSKGTFAVFETGNYGYTVKSVAGPIRCVRDRK